MTDTSSFDVTSMVKMQEVKNAVDQTLKELSQRFDFKGSKSDLALKEKEKIVEVVSDDEYKLRAVLDIFKAKCVKRTVSLKALEYGNVEHALGGTVRQSITIQSGIVDEKAKAIVKRMKENKFKAQAQIHGDHVRVQSKSKDELQAIITFLQQQDFGIDLQFVNYR